MYFENGLSTRIGSIGLFRDSFWQEFISVGNQFTQWKKNGCSERPKEIGFGGWVYDMNTSSESESDQSLIKETWFKNKHTYKTNEGNVRNTCCIRLEWKWTLTFEESERNV